MILAAGSINYPDYVSENYQVFLLTTLIMIIHGFISSMPTKWIANFNSVGSTFNIIALVVVIIIIPAACNREEQGLTKFSPASDVWGTIYEGTDFPAGIAIMMSFTSVIWTMSGYDAPFHLSEECSNANIAAPRAIVLTSAIGGLFGWFLQVIVAYVSIAMAKVYSPYQADCLSDRRGHRERDGLRPRPAMGSLSDSSIATKYCHDLPGIDYCMRVLYGSRLHGRCFASHICLCSRWLFPSLTVDCTCK